MGSGRSSWRLAGALLVAATVSMVAARNAVADETVTIALTTSPTQNPKYDPDNVVAVWVENANGGFVRTLIRYGVRRVKYLRAWNSVSLDRDQINNDPDVITGATRSNHGELVVDWDLTDFRGTPVPDGTYSIRMELADRNADTTSENNEGVFTFEKNGVSMRVSDLSSGGFSRGTIEYVSATTPPPPPPPGEDPVDMCPPAADCQDDDGCCSPDCVYEVDNDCDPATARELPGGCNASGRGTAGSLSLLAIAALALLRRRGVRRRPRFGLRRRRADRHGRARSLVQSTARRLRSARQ